MPGSQVKLFGFRCQREREHVEEIENNSIVVLKVLKWTGLYHHKNLMLRCLRADNVQRLFFVAVVVVILFLYNDFCCCCCCYSTAC